MIMATGSNCDPGPGEEEEEGVFGTGYSSTFAGDEEPLTIPVAEKLRLLAGHL